MTVEEEKQQAFEKYGHFNSSHEVYGVLKEEVDEFWDLVKESRPPNMRNKKYEMLDELTQIAAIALRAIDELKNDKIKFV